MPCVSLRDPIFRALAVAHALGGSAAARRFVATTSQRDLNRHCCLNRLIPSSYD
jgi:hypothetical protein